MGRNILENGNNDMKNTLEKDKKEYIKAYLKVYELANKMKLKDPFQGARGKEIFAAFTLDHDIAEDYQGPDAIDDEGECEYKSAHVKTQIKKFSYAFYIKPTWKEQVRYLKEEKIGRYKNHYMILFNDDGTMKEVWKLTSKQVLDLLLPNLKNRFKSLVKNKTKSVIVNLVPSQVRETGERIL